jgi:hypothetical protein
MIERMWFLRMEQTGDSFSTESGPPEERYDEVQKLLSQDTQSCRILSYVFLVRAPLTFGHSQLVTKVFDAGQHHEADLFEMVVPMIKGAISVFENVLESSRFHERPEFRKLAELTRTHKRPSIVNRACTENHTPNKALHRIAPKTGFPVNFPFSVGMKGMDKPFQ